MPLERIFLILMIVVAIAYIAMLATAMIAILPWGLIGLLILAALGYVVRRLIREHLSNPEDRYYEDNFDR